MDRLRSPAAPASALPRLSPRYSHIDYAVACICPMELELAPVETMLDEFHPSLPTNRGHNAYTLGRLAGHNIVVATMPQIGTNAAAAVAAQLLNDFPSIRFSLLVGIGGGVPGHDGDDDIRLGDIVVSQPTGTVSGVVQYDMGKMTADGVFQRTGMLAKPPTVLSVNVERLKAQHRREGSRVPQILSQMLDKNPQWKGEYNYPGAEHDLFFQATYNHRGNTTCQHCDKSRLVLRQARCTTDPKIHYGTIGSGNVVVRDSATRERLKRDLNIICLEMEAAGLMDTLPCLVIRGICDYADSHKNERWQQYAAAVAAAYMKELLAIIPAQEIAETSVAAEVAQHPTFEFGLQIVDAPDMGSHLFVGRGSELDNMARILRPDTPSVEQRVIALGGMGGIGKTQLAIQYAKRYRACYSSVFWLNATSPTTLCDSLRLLARQVLPPDIENQCDDSQIQVHMARWLSKPTNNRWLLIFDNYDAPDQFDIKTYYPYAWHGSIIITSRIPEAISGCNIMVLPILDPEESLRIMATRSGRRGVNSDPGALQLTKRLGGLPLALSTAGAFLKRSVASFEDYLRHYETKWNTGNRRCMRLPEYSERTLYTTWDVSYAQLTCQNPEAAKLLTLLAYFDNQCVWYKLLLAGSCAEDRPSWFANITKDIFAFEDAIAALVDYCFVEAHHTTKSYSVHVCVHDWILECLNCNVDLCQYWFAFDCVAFSINQDNEESLSALSYRPLAAHALRLVHPRFEGATDPENLPQHKQNEVLIVAKLLHEQDQYKAAEKLYLKALASREKSQRADDVSDLDIINSLGNLYRSQGNLAQSEKMYLQALAGRENQLGPDDILTLRVVNNLGALYVAQGKLAQAEQRYQRALAGKEDKLGPDDISTLSTVNNMGVMYDKAGRLAEAEEMYKRALAGREKQLKRNHCSTLKTINNLGALYAKQGKFAQAEEMYQIALAGKEETVGADHISTIKTIGNLGELYYRQGRLAEAAGMYERAWAGKVKVFGLEDRSTRLIEDELDKLHLSLGQRWSELKERWGYASK